MNTFTHYLVPKEDGMLLGLNKFPKVDLSEEGIDKASILPEVKHWLPVGYKDGWEGGFHKCAENLLNK